MNAHQPAPDRAALSAFVGAIFRHADPGTFIALRAYPDRGKEEPACIVNEARLDDPRIGERAFNRAREAAQWPFPVVFCPPTSTFVAGKKADQQSLANGVALSVECDSNPGKARRDLEALLGPATMVVSSGGVWTDPETGEVEDKLHIHWRLSEPTREEADHARLKRARKLACAVVGADPTAVSLVHPLRWPGSIHRKGKPRLARIVAQSEHEIELGEALEILEAAAPEPAKARAPGGQGGKLWSALLQGAEDDAHVGDVLDVAAALAAIPNAGLEWADWNRIGMAAWRATEGRGFAAFDAWSQKSDKYDAEATAGRWEHYSTSPPDKIGAGTLFMLAAEAVPGWRRPTLLMRDARQQGASEQTSEGQRDARGKQDSGFGPSGGAEQPKAERVPSVFVYGDVEPESPPWFVRGALPQKQVAIVGGQSRAGKTFVALHLSLCAMRGLPFIDYEVERPGAVLWLAAEMASEVSIRLKAAASLHCGDALVGQLPFVQQRFEVPSLSKPDALEQIMALVREAKAVLAERFPGVDLVLIVLDTLGSAADFQDENSAAETQRVMSLLRRLSDGAGALVVAVDHYGKAETTGVRGSSAKTAAADAILGVLADIDNTTGEITNRRLTIQKLRSAPTGRVVPFSLKPVPIDAFGNTHCGIEWGAMTEAGGTKAKASKAPDWSGDKGLILKGCIERMLIDHGTEQQPFGRSGPKVKAVHLDKVRDQFNRTYPGETAEAKSKAFRRALADAVAKKLVGTYQIGASLTDWVWLTRDEITHPV